MGKEEQQQDQEGNNNDNDSSSRGGGGGEGEASSYSSRVLFCKSCSIRIRNQLSFRCVLVLVFSLCLLVSGMFWILPSPSSPTKPSFSTSGFDASNAIKLSASVQAYFRLEKPVAQLLPHIERLEYDIYDEVGVPNTKVAVLSMHLSNVSNWTDVVFGVLSDPMNTTINPVSLSMLRSPLIEIYLQQSNLTLTRAIFGQPSVFEILKVQGGITIIPVQYSIWQIPHTLFNFTLNNSISEILENFIELKNELKYGLLLRSYENVFVQITNADGSTVTPPVTVQASVVSDFGSLLPQRLKQLAQTISDSPAQNLGLDNSVFGKVKGVTLSSYLKGTLHAAPPTPSEAPSPNHSDFSDPSMSPSPAVVVPVPLTPRRSPSHGHTRVPSPKSLPRHSSSHHVYSPASSPITAPCARRHCRHCNYPIAPTASPPHLSPTPHPPPIELPPGAAPTPEASHGSILEKGSTSPSPSPSPFVLTLSSSAAGPLYGEIQLLGLLYGMLVVYCCFPH